MKAYGITIADAPKDCTAIGKFGYRKMHTRCVCGKTHGKTARKLKSAGRERNKIRLLKLMDGTNAV
jgi:hypothetical protein